jgi:toxin ParE1/3/4
MEYRVDITRRAERDLASLYVQINAIDSECARLWCRGLATAILGLSKLPNLNPITPEGKQLRHLLYGRKPHIYRVIYKVLSKPKVVHVLHIRHGARKRFTTV